MTLTVLQVIPNLGAGGAEQACVDIVKGLVERGNRALVVSAGGTRVAEVERAGGKHTLYNVRSKNPAKIFKNALWLARFIREEKVDIVHVRSRAPAWSVWLAVQFVPCRFVATFHAAYKFSNPLKKYYNRIMTRADRIIAISDFIAAHIRNAYGIENAKIRTIPRGIDLEHFVLEHATEDHRDTLRQAWHISPDERIVLVPARLSPIKGQDLVIKAMALLHPHGEKFVAVIVGDDQGRQGYRQELEDLIRSEQVQDRVRLVPHCTDMPAAYSLASAVAVPSRVPEGFGRVPVEAMAMGVPVIASSLGATRETMIEGENGWLLPPEDPCAWAEAIQKALSLPAESRADMARSSIQRARMNFDRRQMIAKTLAVYDELMGRGA